MKYTLHGYVPCPTGVEKEDKVEERENSEVKQFFGRAVLCDMMKDGQTDVELEIVL